MDGPPADDYTLNHLEGKNLTYTTDILTILMLWRKYRVDDMEAKLKREPIGTQRRKLETFLVMDDFRWKGKVLGLVPLRDHARSAPYR